MFELVNSSGTYNEIVRYSFCSQLSGGVCLDGAGPDAGLIMDASGNLYGTTPVGGPTDNGTVFEISQVARRAYRCLRIRIPPRMGRR